MTTATEIADKIADDQNLTKAQAKSIVDSVFKQIAQAAKSGAETIRQVQGQGDAGARGP